MTVAEDVKQAIQAFLVPELDAIKAQIAEVRGVQGQMSDKMDQIIMLLSPQNRAILTTCGEVKLSGFGNFTIREKQPRPGRNSKTALACEITARRAIRLTWFPARSVLESRRGAGKLDGNDRPC